MLAQTEEVARRASGDLPRGRTRGHARMTVYRIGASAFAHPTEVPIHVSAPLARNSSSQWM